MGSYSNTSKTNWNNHETSQLWDTSLLQIFNPVEMRDLHISPVQLPDSHQMLGFVVTEVTLQLLIQEIIPSGFSMIND